MRMKQHSEGTQCERPSLFPRTVSVIRISQFIHLYFKEGHHILRQHVEMSEAAVHSQKQPGFRMTGWEKLAQLKLSRANPSGKIPLSKPDRLGYSGWDAEGSHRGQYLTSSLVTLVYRRLSFTMPFSLRRSASSLRPEVCWKPGATCLTSCLSVSGSHITCGGSQTGHRSWQTKSGNAPAQGMGFPELTP